ncbi:DUF6596 domain-containing protein [Streptomyces collinus]
MRLTRMLHRLVPGDTETAGLLALMLLTDARRPPHWARPGNWCRWRSRTAADGLVRWLAEVCARPCDVPPPTGRPMWPPFLTSHSLPRCSRSGLRRVMGSAGRWARSSDTTGGFGRAVPGSGA